MSGGNYASRWQRRLLRTRHGDDPTFTASYLAVLVVLSSYADYEDGTDARPGFGNLTAITGLSSETVGRAIRWAKDRGWIVQTKAAGKGNHPAVYRLTFPLGQERSSLVTDVHDDADDHPSLVTASPVTGDRHTYSTYSGGDPWSE